MSKKTSPVSGPSRRPRRSPGTRPTHQPRRMERAKASATQAVPVGSFSTRDAMRTYIKVAILPNAVVLAFVIAAAFAGLLLTSTTLSALPATIAQLWLILNAAPVSGRGVDVSLMPLLPAFLVGYGTYRRVQSSPALRGSLKDMAHQAAWAVGIPVLLTLTAIVMLVDASTVFDVAAPNVSLALLRTALLYIVAVAFAMRGPLWKAIAHRFGFPEAASGQIRRALTLCLLFMAAGAMITLISLVVHYQQISELSENYSGLGNLAVWVISMLYLPNAAIAGWGLMLGSEFSMGVGSVSLYGSTLPPLPPVSLMAALPLSVHPVALGLLLVPATIVIVVVARKVPSLVDSLFLIGSMAVFATLLFFYAGGSLGVYGYVGPAILLSILLTVVWVAIAALITAAVAFAVARFGGAGEEVINEEEGLCEDVEVAADTEPQDEDVEGDEFAEEADEDLEEFVEEGSADELMEVASLDVEDYLLDEGWDDLPEEDDDGDEFKFVESLPEDQGVDEDLIPGEITGDIPVIGEPLIEEESDVRARRGEEY